MNSEILSADSRQVYKELNKGTSKPTQVEMEAIVHHFISTHSIHERFTVFDFAREGHALLSRIYQKSATAFLVGGSGLFVDAVVNGMDELPDVASGIREDLNKQLGQEGCEMLFARLAKLDPEYAAVVDENNPRRIIRALEVCLGTGKPFSSFLGQSSNSPDYDVCKIGLDIPRDILYDRINKRVDKMVGEGLVEEVRGLATYCELPSLRTVGYQELLEHFQGRLTLDEAIEKIKRNTRRYAKRQLTWFKRDDQIVWFQPHQEDLIRKHIENSLDIIANL
jgi:tRNA dimethylallyltransferase